MTSFYYYDQNPLGFCFLGQIRAFVIQTSLGLQNLNMKGKTKRTLVVVVKLRHGANGLLEQYMLTLLDFNQKGCQMDPGRWLVSLFLWYAKV